MINEKIKKKIQLRMRPAGNSITAMTTLDLSVRMFISSDMQSNPSNDCIGLSRNSQNILKIRIFFKPGNSVATITLDMNCP
jgi:hypothetical protein